MHQIIKKIRRNPVKTVLLITMIGSGFSSFGNLNSVIVTSKEIKAVADQNNAEEMRLALSVEHEKEQAKIAEQRYKDGCIMIVAGQDANTWTSLAEGYPVVDRVRRKSIPAGSVVCDVNGNTGVMMRQKQLNGKSEVVVSAVAFTGNKAVVEAAKIGVTRRYYVPHQ